MSPKIEAAKEDIAMGAALLIIVASMGYFVASELPEEIDESEIQPSPDAECYGMGCTLQHYADHPLETVVTGAVAFTVAMGAGLLQRWKA